jgi:predicted Zn-dependent protease
VTIGRPILLVALLAVGHALVLAQSASDPMSAVEAAVVSAEQSLRDGELQLADSRYRTGLFHGWMLVGGLDIADGRPLEARDAFTRASTVTVEPKEALQSLALIELRFGHPSAAVEILTRVAGADPKDRYTRRMLAQALVANGQPEQGVQELSEAYARAPDDLELAFLLGSGYLSLKKVEAAQQLFAKITLARPEPQTYVLIGRTYRDAGEYDRARSALLTATKKDPRVRRAHYYLGTIAVLAEGAVRLDEAIDEFKKELTIAPDDPVATLRLGMALVEAQRPAEALPVLKSAAKRPSAPPDAFHYLGRCQLALDRPDEAVPALRRALELSQGEGADQLRLLGIHYQLALALRKTGAQAEAAAEFADAEKLSAKRADTSRERLTRYLTDVPDQRSSAAPVVSFMDSLELGASPLSGLTAAQRIELRSRLKVAMTRAYLNLGIMQARSSRFARAAELLESASAIDPGFPQLQYSLGVAYFSAQKYEKAAAPLTRALAERPADPTVRRMLALTSLKTDAYEKAANLLANDPQRGEDVSLQYAYALALVRSNRPREAEQVFAQLLQQHGDTAELNVLLGQAHAQQGDYDGSVTALTRALALKPDVPEANAALGLIYMQQGKLQEATTALRAELKAHPADVKARQTLATVLDLDGHQEDALTEVRSVLKISPEFADARYLLGKILLARGAVQEAAETLEAAVRLAPDDANIHYQLGQAYQKLGRTDDARREFDAFQRLKDKRAGRKP